MASIDFCAGSGCVAEVFDGGGSSEPLKEEDFVGKEGGGLFVGVSKGMDEVECRDTAHFGVKLVELCLEGVLERAMGIGVWGCGTDAVQYQLSKGQHKS